MATEQLTEAHVAVDTSPTIVGDPNEKADYYLSEKDGMDEAQVESIDDESILAENMMENGKERPIESANDMATR